MIVGLGGCAGGEAGLSCGARVGGYVRVVVLGVGVCSIALR